MELIISGEEKKLKAFAKEFSLRFKKSNFTAKLQKEKQVKKEAKKNDNE